MKVEPSGVEGLELIGPDAAEFNSAVEALLGRKPDEVLRPALRYSVIARNYDLRPVALLGVRFDMAGENAKTYSVVHYADTLRYPERADLTPGAIRFVCAEPLYTDLVLRRAREVERRGRMNLENLRRMLRMRASVDCAAFADGQFGGPDSLGAFDRLACEREAERALDRRDPAVPATRWRTYCERRWRRAPRGIMRCSRGATLARRFVRRF